jgi:hypothetical protein
LYTKGPRALVPPRALEISEPAVLTVFNYSMTKVVKKCPEHDPTLAMIDE